MKNPIDFEPGVFRRARRENIAKVISECPAEILDAKGNQPTLEIGRVQGKPWYWVSVLPRAEGVMDVQVADSEHNCIFVEGGIWRGIAYVHRDRANRRSEHFLYLFDAKKP